MQIVSRWAYNYKEMMLDLRVCINWQGSGTYCKSMYKLQSICLSLLKLAHSFFLFFFFLFSFSIMSMSAITFYCRLRKLVSLSIRLKNKKKNKGTGEKQEKQLWSLLYSCLFSGYINIAYGKAYISCMMCNHKKAAI